MKRIGPGFYEATVDGRTYFVAFNHSTPAGGSFTGWTVLDDRQRVVSHHATLDDAAHSIGAR